jgi:hypothetical protein
MTIAASAQASVAYITEVVAGTTPATPAFQTFRAKGDTMKVVRDRVTASELNGRRGQQTSVIAAIEGGGNIPFDFSFQTVDDFLESCLRNVWASNILTDANTQKTFTLETKFETGGTDIYKRFTGAQVDTLAFEMTPGAVISGSVGFMTRGADFFNAIFTGATYVAANNEIPLIGANVASIAAAGLTLDNTTKISVSLNNNLRTQRTLNGLLAPIGHGAGTFEATGVISLYMDSVEYDVLSAYAAGTETSLDFRIGNAASKNTRFEFPRIVLADAEANPSSSDGDVMINIPWRALQASSISGAVCRVTRNL